MFRIAHRAALAAGVASLIVAAPMQAQWSPSVLVKLGLTAPIGDPLENFKAGYHVGIGAEFSKPIAPIGLRLEADFHEMEHETLDTDFRILAGIANLVFAPSRRSGPYFLGGVGLYRGYYPDIEDSGETNVGINAGVGLTFGLTGFSTFVEARLHNVFSEGESQRIIPISFGVRF